MLKDFLKLLLLSIISVIFFVLLYKFLCGEEIIPKKENRYYFIVDDASGIRYNTKLYLNGYQIGKITKIEFDYDTMKTKINITTNKKIKLKKDSYITIVSDLLGNKALILNIGSGKELDNNTCIECKSSLFSFSQALNHIQEIITKISELQKTIDIEEIKNKILGMFTGDGEKSGFMDLIVNINDIMKNINLLIEDFRKTDSKETMANIKNIVKNINLLIEDFRKTDSKETIANINNIVKNINLLIEDFRKTNPNETLTIINDILRDFKENVITWIQELKEKNKGKGLMSFSF